MRPGRNGIVLAVVAAWCAGGVVAPTSAQTAGIDAQRLGGPLVSQFGYRPFVFFQNGQFAGYGYATPYGVIPPMWGPAGYGAPLDAEALYGGQSYAAYMVGPVQTGAAPTPAASGAYAIARLNDAFEAAYDKEGALVVRWKGEPTCALRVTFATLDGSKVALKQIVVDRMPTEARFDANPNAYYLRATVDYVNGTTNAMTVPIRAPSIASTVKAAAVKPTFGAAPSEGAAATGK